MAIKRSEISKDAIVLSNVWVFKLKGNGERRARLNARGYEQQDRIHYDSDLISSPVTHLVAI